jgi:hypothetical protein
MEAGTVGDQGEGRRDQSSITRLAGLCLYASGVVSIFGIAFLLLFFAGIDSFGPINDIMVAVQYSLMLMIPVWVGRRQSNRGDTRATGVMLVGLLGMLSVVVLQAMLVLRLIPFSRQIGPVIVAFLVVLAWFLITGRMARADDLIDSSIPRLVGAGLYVGYPFWAFRQARRLLSS